MLRADNVVCGTSSTGTGTLTLAACPSPPGGLDFYNWLTATGLNFVSTNAVLVSYTIIEYTDATFVTAKQTEKGVGTLTVGASLTASTLARTTVQSKVLTMNATPALTVAAPTAITIGTAANTLLFVGASVSDLMGGFGPYFDSSNIGSGIAPVGMGEATGSYAVTTGNVIYVPVYWPIPKLVKTFTARMGNASYTGGTSNVYAAIYDTNSSGQPGKLLLDFGVLGTAGSSLSTSTFTNFASATHASGLFMTHGLYWAAIFCAFSGGAGSPALAITNPSSGGPAGLGHSIWGLSSAANKALRAEATATANPAPDPATLTAYFIYGNTAGTPGYPVFWMF